MKLCIWRINSVCLSVSLSLLSDLELTNCRLTAHEKPIDNQLYSSKNFDSSIKTRKHIQDTRTQIRTKTTKVTERINNPSAVHYNQCSFSYDVVSRASFFAVKFIKVQHSLRLHPIGFTDFGTIFRIYSLVSYYLLILFR